MRSLRAGVGLPKYGCLGAGRRTVEIWLGPGLSVTRAVGGHAGLGVRRQVCSPVCTDEGRDAHAHHRQHRHVPIAPCNTPHVQNPTYKPHRPHRQPSMRGSACERRIAPSPACLDQKHTQEAGTGLEGGAAVLRGMRPGSRAPAHTERAKHASSRPGGKYG